MFHKPVMLDECIESLDINPDGVYVDATFGRGGHSEEILNKLSDKGQLFAFDQDVQAVDYAKKAYANDLRFVIIESNFENLKSELNKRNIAKVDGILFDFGVSSPQLDNAERGFSFNKNGPLDMRMNTSNELSAKTFVNQASVYEIADVIRDYGEERFAKRIADKILAYRESASIEDTLTLADIVSSAIPDKFKYAKGVTKHPATKTFQAIRIYVNRELDVIKNVLPQAVDCLAVGGRLVVMSFHSLEDRIVKQFMAKHSKFDDYPEDLPIQIEESMGLLTLVGKKIKANKTELDVNPRSRSAVLRVAQKNREGLCSE